MTCCGKPMHLENGVWVCRKCKGSYDPGVASERRVVAVGIIARRTHGRSLRVTCTASGVTGHLRRPEPTTVGGRG
ncbi:hypothetical protein B0E38_04757 [Streptomyces sp. 111WW2]|nr:hypothetical protein B0E38_04757 [Streptomyces sp. 111WW2]